MLGILLSILNKDLFKSFSCPSECRYHYHLNFIDEETESLRRQECLLNYSLSSYLALLALDIFHLLNEGGQ